MNKSAEKVILDIKAKGEPISQDDLERMRRAWDKQDVPIIFDGRSIVLPAEPAEMPLDKAEEAIARLRKDQEQPYQVFEVFDAYPHDACVAFVKAVRELHGHAVFESEQTWFGPEPPQMLNIRTGIRPEDFVLCPLGQMRLPGLSEPIKTQFWKKQRNDPKCPWQFVISGTIKKKDRSVITSLRMVTDRILAQESIYKGKPLHIRVNEDGELDTQTPPEFLDVQEMHKGLLFYDPEVQDQLDTNILVPITHTEACRNIGIQGKRTVVLSGPFGTGKSLYGRYIAKESEDHGWTYILLDKVKGLKTALEFATRYAPAVVFAEDVERVAGTERTDSVNDLLTVADGVISKSSEVITVLTTNYLEQINKAMMRPGRLDAVIEIKAPGPKTAERIIRHYAGKLLKDNVDLSGAGEALKGQIPAVIREAVDRSKLGMIGRGAKSLSDNDIVVATASMGPHLKQLNKSGEVESNAQLLKRGLAAIIQDSVTDVVKTGIESSDLAEQIRVMRNNLGI